ncbi:hypothetical protein ACHAQJ_009627 [Trichoderma viride]
MTRYAAAHRWASLAGPGDMRPTAMQIIKDYQREGSLEGKVVLVTGVSSGIGVPTAIAMVATGATVFCAGRNIDQMRSALGLTADSPKAHFLELDLCSLVSVRDCARKLLCQTGGTLNILINNAGGVLADYQKTVDGFESQFSSNFLAPFYLFSLVRDALLTSATPESPSRVVNVASIGHRNGRVNFDNLNLEGEYDATRAYGQAKTASIYMASEIDRRFGRRNLHAWSVHPGGILESNFLNNSGWADEAKEKRISRFPKELFKSNEQGAATTVWAAVSAEVLEEAVIGKYLEDCSIAKPSKETESPDFQGYVDHIYDQEDAKRTWEVSEVLIGLSG